MKMRWELWLFLFFLFPTHARICQEWWFFQEEVKNMKNLFFLFHRVEVEGEGGKSTEEKIFFFLYLKLFFLLYKNCYNEVLMKSTLLVGSLATDSPMQYKFLFLCARRWKYNYCVFVSSDIALVKIKINCLRFVRSALCAVLFFLFVDVECFKEATEECLAVRLW